MNADPRAATVLYVEDEESDALFMQMAFASAGLAPALRVVDDGRSALEYLSGNGVYTDRGQYPVPTVVLLDLNLQTLHGFEVLKWIRAQPQYAALPVVLFSSSTKPEDRIRARDLGATEFWEKPSSGLKFGAVVERLKEKWLGMAQAK
jgi:CheY-like chemotaxis protein